MSEKSQASKKYPFIIAVIIFVGVGVIISNVSTPDHSPQPGEMLSSLNSSGPFVIDKMAYNVDEVLFFSINGIPPDEYGKAVFIGPDGKIKNTVFFDGRKNTVLNHYFTPAPASDVENCQNCKLVGQWIIAFEMTEGMNYLPIRFTVLPNT